VAIALAYAFREQLFGTDEPVRLASAGALILIGWAFARSLGHALEPQLVRRLDPGSAGVVGFLVRFLALVTIVLVSLRIAGVDFGAVALGASVDTPATPAIPCAAPIRRQSSPCSSIEDRFMAAVTWKYLRDMCGLSLSPQLVASRPKQWFSSPLGGLVCCSFHAEASPR
jgi:hypothetical protein